MRRGLTAPAQAPPEPHPASLHLSDFVEFTTSFRLEVWQMLLCERLEKLADQRGQRILVHGPPQFGKSVIVSQRLPCWLLGKRPDHRVRLACYNQTHAARFGKTNLALMRSPDYLATFPDSAARVPSVCPAIEWSTAARAGVLDAQPSFMAMGLGSGFTGQGADTLIVDDPYKNREEAYSDTINGGIWDWWTDVVLPRLNMDTNVVVMFHRWKVDDIAGRLLAQGGWEMLRFPAICDGGDDDPTYAQGLRRVGDGLSPRYSNDYLDKVRADQGTSFDALYQGRPFALGGNLIKEAWLQNTYKSLPIFKSVYTIFDLALKDGEQNDETASATFGEGEDGLYLLRVAHGRWNTPDVQKFLCDQADWLKKVYGDAYKGDFVEDKVAGTTLIQYVRRSRPDLAVIPIPAKGSKVERANGVTPILEAGRLRVPDLTIYPSARPWLSALTAQACAFPGGAHDDMVDVLVYGLMKYLNKLGPVRPPKKRRGGYV